MRYELAWGLIGVSDEVVLESSRYIRVTCAENQ